MTVTRRNFSYRPLAAVTFFITCLLLIACSTEPADPPFAADASDDPQSETVEIEETNEVEAAENIDTPPEIIEEAEPTTGQAISENRIPGRIAFISPDGQLGTISPDGEDLRYLTNDGIYQFPAWSPTSNEIAIIGSGRDSNGVFITDDTDENTVRSLYDQTSPVYLYWSPDGSKVSFIARHPNGLALHLAAADGETGTTVLSTGQPLYWQWLPDNQQAITHAGGGDLATVDLEGNMEPIGLGEGGIFQAPALSPSGSLLAYSQGTTIEELSIAIQDRDTGETRFEQSHTGILAMGWSPTADQLAYISPTDGRAAFFGPLRLFDAETNNSEVIVSTDVIAFFWSPDGRYIAFLTLRDRNAFQAQAEKLRASKPAVQEESPRPMISLIVYDTEEKASRLLYNFEPGYLFVTQFLPFFDQYALSHRIWSPDSQNIVMPIRTEDDQDQIAIISVEGGEATIVADGISAFWSHR